MDIQANIDWIHKEIDKVKDPDFIEKLRYLLESRTSPDLVSDIDYNIEYNKDIDNSIRNINEGNYYTTEEIKEMAKKWGRK